MPKLPLFPSWLSAILLFSFLILGCKNKETSNEENIREEKSFLSELATSYDIPAWQFYHAWLADCANDRQVGYEATALKVLTDTARNRINRCLVDPAISTNFPKEKLVWGPVLAVDDVGDDDYVAENMLYCLQHTVPTNIKLEAYSIGIAGTDAISTFDWLSEDLDVQDSVGWLQPTGGHISKGAYTGLQKLLGFKDNGIDIVSFFKQRARGKEQNEIVEIIVSGHSLGGALAQVLASHLANELKEYPNVFIHAYVYAGPTAGNKIFADFLLTQLSSYNAFNNTRDAVPHAWNTDTLKNLCGLYSGLTLCDNSINNSLLVDGVIKYMLEISQSMQYTAPPGKTSYFTGAPYEPTGPNGCSDLQSSIDYAWKYSDIGSVYQNLNAISSQCGGSASITKPQFDQFAYFLAEMGAQHTEAYYNHFLASIPAVAKNLPQYVTGEKGDDIKWDGADALGSILGKASGYLIRNNITICNCQ